MLVYISTYQLNNANDVPRFELWGLIKGFVSTVF